MSWLWGHFKVILTALKIYPLLQISSLPLTKCVGCVFFTFSLHFFSTEGEGGPFFTAALKNMKPGGRIAVCGAIATYNDATPQMCMSHFYWGPSREKSQKKLLEDAEEK